MTGGTGNGGGFFASHRITARIKRNFLYVSNDGSDNISAFSIDTTTGVLTPVPGSPFPTGGSADGLGISLAATPRGRFLYAANAGWLQQHLGLQDLVEWSAHGNHGLSFPCGGNAGRDQGDPQRQVSQRRSI